jgi:hypothetical protein
MAWALLRPHHVKAAAACAPLAKLRTSCWRANHGYLRCVDRRRNRPASPILRAAEHFRQHRQLTNGRLQGNRHLLRGSRVTGALGEQTSGGVIASSVETNTVQGSIQSSSVATNMAIDGAGFLWWRNRPQPPAISRNSPAPDDYTRAGDFQMNSSGYLVNSAGYYLMGIPVNATTGDPEGSVPQVLQFNNEFIPAQETTSISYEVNLPSTPTSGTIDLNDFANNPDSRSGNHRHRRHRRAGCGRYGHRDGLKLDRRHPVGGRSRNDLRRQSLDRRRHQHDPLTT